MENKKIETCIGKNSDNKNHEKKVYGLNLTVETVNKLEKIIGYNSRSEIIDNLISDYLDKKKSLDASSRLRDKSSPSNQARRFLQ